MNTIPDFKFDRVLTNEEFNFWSSFFDHCPFDNYVYTQGIISSFAKEKKSLDLNDYYEKIKKFEHIDELIELFNNSKLTIPFKENYSKAINKLDKIFPNSKPLELFFMSIYSGFCQNMNFELTSVGLNALPSERATHVAELGFLVDFMESRATQIFPHLNINPVKLSGAKTYTHEKSKAVYTICINNSLVTRVTNENKKNHYEFAFDVGYDFSRNTNEKLEIYSGLGNEQETLLKLIEINYLESTLKVNKSSYNNKIKI